MKKIFIIALYLLLVHVVHAQAPAKFRYQAVARDQNGTVITGNIDIRLSFLEDNANGSARYAEQHTVTTNTQGVFDLTIGEGTPVSGDFNLLTWESHQYWLKVELKSPEDASFTEMGKTQLLSVPYAMYSAKSGTDLKAGAGINIANGIINNTGDLSNTNELQTLTVNGNQLSISDGNSVTLPTGTTYTEGLGIEIIGNNISAIDDSPTNEIQELSLNGQELSLSKGGGSVILPSGGSSQWSTNGNVISNMPTSGNVAIGNSSSFNSKLYVSSEGGNNAGTFYAPVGNALHAENDGTSAAIWSRTDNGTAGEFWTVNGKAGYFNSANGIAGQFESGGIALIAPNGNVGIGLANPARKLHVVGSTLMTNPNGTALEIGEGNVGVGITSPTHKFEVNGASYFQSPNGPSLIVGNGNVGLGTTSPTYKLHVIGGNEDGIFGSSINGFGISGVSTGNSPAGYFHASNGAAGEFTSDNNLCISAIQGATGTASNNQGILLKNAGDNWKMFIDNANDYNFAFNSFLKAWILDTDGSYHNSSDRSLKKNIEPFSNVLSRLTKLQAYTYRMKSAPDDSPISVGFMAQEVEEQFPQLVTEKEGYKSLCYDHFAVLSVQAIKEQQAEIEDLNKQINELREMVIELSKK